MSRAQLADPAAAEAAGSRVPGDMLEGPIAGDGAEARRRRAGLAIGVVSAVVVGIGVFQQGETAGRRAAEQKARSAAETAYLTVLRAAPVAGSILPQGLTGLTDEQLLAFGWQACGAYAQGSTVAEIARAHGDLVAAVPGRPELKVSPPNPMLPLVADTASRQLCPDLLGGADPGPPAQRWESPTATASSGGSV